MATPKQIRRRGRLGLILGTIVTALAVAAVALADNVISDTSDTLSGAQHAITLSATPGQEQDFPLSLLIDCQTQKHMNGATTLSYSTESDVPAGGTLSATAVTISKPGGWPADNSNCTSSDQQTSSQTSVVTVKAPSSPGSYSYTLKFDSSDSDVSVKGGDSEAAITLNVSSPTPADTTKPTLHLPSDQTVEATSASGAAVTFSATADDEDPAHPSVDCIPSSGSTFALGTTTVHCSATDAAGNEQSGSFDVTVEDTTAPDSGSISINGGDAWTNDTGVSLDLSAHDAGVTGYRLAESTGGLASASTVSVTSASSFSANDIAFTLGSGDAASKTVFVRFYDAAGHYSDASDIIGLDTVRPVITGGTGSYVPGTWTNQSVTVSFSCADTAGPANSGIASSDIGGDTLTASGADQSVTNTGSCTDNAGNVAAPATVGDIDIDKVAPSVGLVGGPADGASYYFGFVPAAPTCSASDALSGLNGSCSVSGYGSTVGPHTVTAGATDNAGNMASASATYIVLAWTLGGFYQPVDMGGVLNTVKNGSTVPLKFEIFAGPTELTSTSYVTGLSVRPMTCETGTLEDAIEMTATGGTVLRYDTTGGQFIYNWQTPKMPGKCYFVTDATADGGAISANFKLK
jgi:hypothetical protein